MARWGGRVVSTVVRNLSFVRQVPSNGEEHEKNSDDDPNIDAEHKGMKPRCDLVGVEKAPPFRPGGRG